MTTLRQRADDFLNRAVPAEINYVPDSIVERFIRRFASGDRDFDNEQRELLELCAVESAASSEQFKTPEARAYFAECAAIAEAILTDLASADKAGGA